MSQTDRVNGEPPALAILDGFHAWKHAVRFGAVFERFVTDDSPALRQLVDALAPDLIDAANTAEVLTSDALGALAQSVGLRTVHHTGVLAIAHRSVDAGFTRQAGRRNDRPVVLVDHPRHLGNLGAVIRAVAAVDGAGVFTSGDVDPWHPGVVRAAAGLHFAIDVCRFDDDDLSSIDGPVLGLDAGGDDLFTYDIAPGAVIAVGAERSGLSPAVRKRVDGLVSLPMRNGVSSLNLATSVAAALYVMKSRHP
jgi:RNA methyltransferase, TrmH family